MLTLGRMGLRLGIDMDGVVADFNGGWMDAFNAERGTSLHPDLVDGWDVLPTLTGFTDMSAFWDWARDLGAGHSVFRHLSPFPGAIQTLQCLVAAGHDVVIITAKPDWSIPDTLSWLGDHRIQAPFPPDPAFCAIVEPTVGGNHVGALVGRCRAGRAKVCITYRYQRRS